MEGVALNGYPSKIVKMEQTKSAWAQTLVRKKGGRAEQMNDFTHENPAARKGDERHAPSILRPLHFYQQLMWTASEAQHVRTKLMNSKTFIPVCLPSRQLVQQRRTGHQMTTSTRSISELIRVSTLYQHNYTDGLGKGSLTHVLPKTKNSIWNQSLHPLATISRAERQ